MLVLRICENQESGVASPQVINDANTASLASPGSSPPKLSQTTGTLDDVTSVRLFKQVQLQLAMILRTQQIVDLFRINRGLDELKGHQEKDTPLAEDVNGGFFLFLAQRLAHPRRAIRYHGFCHPAAKAKRERIAFHTGRPLLLGPPAVKAPKPPATCPCCGEPMIRLLTLLPAWRSTPNRAPPHKLRSCA